jgi:hypothetical protein
MKYQKRYYTSWTPTDPDFFWQGDNHKKKYRLAKWSIICRPKDQGGLGILDLEIQNKCLLSKWLFNLINGDGDWQQLIKNKYLGNKSLTQVRKKPGDSQFWSGLMEIKDQFISMGNFKVQDGSQIRFWEDKWLGVNTLKDQYPNLYNIVRKKSVTIADVFSTRPLNVSFRRNLVAANLQSWRHLVLRIANIHLNKHPDVFRWTIRSDGKFSVSSMYQSLLDSDIIPHNSHLWKIRVPLKIKVFLWLVYRESILTKDNLVKRNWHGNGKCCFCNDHETVQHLFFDCALAKFIWRIIHLACGLSPPTSIRNTFGAWVRNIKPSHRQLIFAGIGAMLWAIWLSRNDITFNKSPILSYMQVIYRGTHRARTWSVFQKEEGRQVLHSVCRSIEILTMEVFTKHGWRFSNRLSL